MVIYYIIGVVAEGVKVPEFDKIANFGPLLGGHKPYNCLKKVYVSEISVQRSFI